MSHVYRRRGYKSNSINSSFRTIGEFVREKLEILRQSIAADVIKDLLYDSVKEDASFDEAPSISTESTDSIPEPALPIPIKSFSFI